MPSTFQQYVKQELPDVHPRSRKGRGTRYQTANSCGIIEKANEFQKKNSTSVSLTMLKALTVLSSVQLLSHVWLCNPMDCSTPGLNVHHQLPEFTETHFHWVGGTIQPSHPLSSPSPPAFNLSQNQGLLKWVSSSQQIARVLEFQLQHQSFQRIYRTDFL